MGLLSRMATVVKAKVSKLIERAEDPRETLEYSYEKQLELLQNVKRGIVEVATSKRRLELQAAQLDESIAKLGNQAQQALAAGREDLARVALQRKQDATVQRQGLESQITEMQKEQDKLTTTESRLQAKIEAFRTQKELIKAQYSTAEAQVKISEATTGISEEMGDVGLAVERAQEKTERMRARAGAIDELIASGTLDEFAGGKDALDRELAKVESSKAVDTELEAMKKQIGAGREPKQLGAGQ